MRLFVLGRNIPARRKVIARVSLACVTISLVEHVRYAGSGLLKFSSGRDTGVNLLSILRVSVVRHCKPDSSKFFFMYRLRRRRLIRKFRLHAHKRVVRFDTLVGKRCV